jgi:hypothetical protein
MKSPRTLSKILAAVWPLIGLATAQTSLVNGKGGGITNPAAFRTALGGSSSGSALFTDNPNALKNTFAKVIAGYSGSGQINVMTAGDSLSAGINAPNGGLAMLEHRWGIAGVGVGGIGVYGGPSVSGGASVSSTDYARWWNGNVAVVPAAGEAVYDYNTTGPIYCNRIRIFYIKEDAVGKFKVQTSFNGAAYADENSTRTSGVTTNGSPNISFATSGGVIPPLGMIVTGTGIPVNTYVVSATATTAVLNQNATATGSGLTFTFSPNVDTDNNASTAAGIITLDKSAAANVGLYRVKIVGLTGTVRIIGALFDHTGMSGVVRTSLSKGSSDFTEWDDCPASVINTVIGSIAPDLTLFANVGTTTEGALNTMFGRLSTAHAASDRIIFGVWPNATATEVTENPVLEAWARANSAAYVSPTWHWPTHAALQAAGLSADATHPTATGYALMTSWAFERVLAGWPAITPVLPGGGGSGVPYNILTAGRLLEPGSGIQTVNLTQSLSAPFIAVSQSASGGLVIRDRSLTGSSDQHAIYRSGGALVTEAAGGSASYTSLNNLGHFEFFPSLSAGDNRLGRSANRWGRIFTNGIYLASSTKTGAYTATDRDHLLLCDATSAAFTVTLPAVASNSGLVLVVKKIDASGNAVTLDGNASETIDGATTLALTAQWNRALIQSNGTAWFRID